MKAPEALLAHLGPFPRWNQVQAFGALLHATGDFDSMEYAQALVPAFHAWSM